MCRPLATAEETHDLFQTSVPKRPGCVRTHLAKERDVSFPFDVHVVQISNRTKINILLHRASELYDLESDGADDDSFGPTALFVAKKRRSVDG